MNARIALSGDVINSRTVPEFAVLRDQALSQLSSKHREQGYISSDYAITAWDEFQVLLDVEEGLPQLVWDLHRSFQPLRLRLGVGRGGIIRVDDTVKAVNEDVSGEAFYKAREALKSITDQRREGSRAGIKVLWDDVRMTRALNASFRLLDVLIGLISEKQWRVIIEFERLGRQDRVAELLGKQASTISRSLNSAHYWEIKASLSDLTEWLRDL